jgi:hypothetical protein
MRFYFEGDYDNSQVEDGKKAKISARPYTSNKQQRELFVLVANEIATPQSGINYKVALVGLQKTPMIFPPKDIDFEDTRILVMGRIASPGHRKDGYIHDGYTTGQILNVSRGGGAFGAGSVFIALMKDGQKVVSNMLEVWYNDGGTLKQTTFESQAQYDLAYGINTQIEFL